MPIPDPQKRMPRSKRARRDLVRDLDRVVGVVDGVPGRGAEVRVRRRRARRAAILICSFKLDAGMIGAQRDAHTGHDNKRIPMSTAVISRRGVERLRAGHPWIYRSDVLSCDGQPGDLVRVETERTRICGLGVLERRARRSRCGCFARRRARRSTSGSSSRNGCGAPSSTGRCSRSTPRPAGWSTARRIGCPALIVDRYADWLVVQTLTQGMDRRLRSDRRAARRSC